mgnify:CR=1 FL=1
MNFELFTEDYMPLVMAACLILGYLIKKSLDIIPNRYIPSILAVTGAVLGCVVQGSISPENVVYGAMTGLASTGMHQNFKRFIEKEK